jgi:hypothetical protein
MSRWLKILSSAAIVLGGIVMASAATKHDKNAIHMRNRHAQAAAAAPASGFSDRDSPAATGGGSLGYNQNIYRF